MGIVVGVVAHYTRRSMAKALADTVGAVTCREDDGTLQCEGNHIEVLRTLNQAALPNPNTWCVVLEDDAQPVRAFTHHLQRALRHAPAPVVGLYLGGGNPSGETARQVRQAAVRAMDSRKAWIVGDCLIGSVGYAVADYLMDDMIDFIDKRVEELPKRISRWVQRRSLQVAYTQPSLVDHGDYEPIKPAPPGRAARRAWNYGLPPSTWDTGVVQLGHCPDWSAGTDTSFEIGAQLAQFHEWNQFHDPRATT